MARMKNLDWIIITLVAMLAISVMGIQLVSPISFPHLLLTGHVSREPPAWVELLPALIVAKIMLTTVNLVLLTVLLILYADIYHKTGSSFSLGLMIFAVALLLYTITENPVVHGVAGFKVSGLGPFTILPDFFTCVASAILLYLSRQ